MIVNPVRRFWFTLALRLGMTVRELQERMDSREFSEWIAFNQLDPIGEWRADARSATVAAVVSAAHGGSSKVSDFVLDFEPQDRPAGDMAAQMQAYFKSHAEGRATIA